MMYVALNPDGDRHCGLSIQRLGEYTAVGFAADGTKQWEYRLPTGEYARQVPRLQSAQLPGGQRCWLIVAANGSIHWLDMNGEQIDRFDYGHLLTGIATSHGDEGTFLWLATEQNVTAWSLEH